MRQFVFSGVREVRRAIVATAVATSVLLPLWWLPDAGALLAAAILFVLSAGAYGLVDKGEMPRHESTCVDAPSMGRGEMRRWAAPAGVCVLMMGFGFAQYTAYHYGLPETNPISWEVFSHILAIVLLAGAVYGARDGELTLGFKMATTLMLFSFVLLAVLWPSIGASAALAAATDGMLELVLLLALVEYVSARGFPSFELSAAISHLWRELGWLAVRCLCSTTLSCPQLPIRSWALCLWAYSSLRQYGC
ncbi:MAG: hypothetical protein ACLTDR_08980 [Adlercreutzia equolifaciens]